MEATNAHQQCIVVKDGAPGEAANDIVTGSIPITLNCIKRLHKGQMLPLPTRHDHALNYYLFLAVFVSL